MIPGNEEKNGGGTPQSGTYGWSFMLYVVIKKNLISIFASRHFFKLQPSSGLIRKSLFQTKLLLYHKSYMNETSFTRVFSSKQKPS